MSGASIPVGIDQLEADQFRFSFVSGNGASDFADWSRRTFGASDVEQQSHTVTLRCPMPTVLGALVVAAVNIQQEAAERYLQDIGPITGG